MADYTTQEVITSPVLLTDDLVSILQMKGAEVVPTGEKQNVLDGIVHGAMLSEYYVTFESGWSDYCETFEEWAGENLDEDEEAQVSDYVKENFNLGKEDLMREILKVNPEANHIEMQAGWSCSRMRLDGFGGSGLIVNRKGYLYITTSNFIEDEDGVIQHGNDFHFWEPEEVEHVEAA